MVTEDYVQTIFKSLEQGDGAGFFEHVDDNVDWIVEGTHPLAGHYKSKSDFLAGTSVMHVYLLLPAESKSSGALRSKKMRER